MYANGTYGIAVGLGSAQPAAGVALVNNTVFANGRWGIAIGHPGAPSTGTVVRNNILHGTVRGGVAAQLDSLEGLTIGFNLNDDGYGDSVVADATDSADPQFVAPAGADGVLGARASAATTFTCKRRAPPSMPAGRPLQSSASAGPPSRAWSAIKASSTSAITMEPMIGDRLWPAIRLIV